VTFFDTLKDKNMKAMFGVIAMHKHGKDGKSQDDVMRGLSFDERLEIFTLVHNLLKSIGANNWQKPQYLNRDGKSDHYYDTERNK
jgi:hypothetical protein